MDALQTALLVLSTVPGLGAEAREATAAALLDPLRRQAVLDAFGRGDPEPLEGWDPHGAAALELSSFQAQDRALQTADRCRLAGVELIFRSSEHYPRGLLDLEHAPPVLFKRGAADALDVGAGWVAMVGSRRPTEAGLRFARRAAAEFAAAGLTVVSGLALGTDAAVHLGALDAGGRTVAVLASGADEFTPRSNSAIGRRMLERGAVVSEHPPGTRVHAWSFPDRNRIIAALATCTVVLEAGLSSGTTLTAEAALELGRELYVLPGRPGDAATAGGLELLSRGGVGVFRGSQDVLPRYPRVSAASADPGLGADLLQLAQLMAEHLPCRIDDLIEVLGLDDRLPALIGGINLLRLHGLLHEDGAGILHLTGELPGAGARLR